MFGSRSFLVIFGFVGPVIIEMKLGNNAEMSIPAIKPSANDRVEK